MPTNPKSLFLANQIPPPNFYTLAYKQISQAIHKPNPPIKPILSHKSKKSLQATFLLLQFPKIYKKAIFGIYHHRASHLPFVALYATLFVPACQSLRTVFLPLTHQKAKDSSPSRSCILSFLSASIFSGLVIWAMLGFVFNYKILAMLIIWLIVFIFEIKRHKKLKLIRVEADFNIREAFFKWAKTKYLFDFCAFGLIFILWS